MRELLSKNRKIAYYRDKHGTDDRSKWEYSLEVIENGEVIEHGFGSGFDDYIDRKWGGMLDKVKKIRN